MNQSKINARAVAEYFLEKVDEESGGDLTNLKLQKLLYYAQGFCLALRDEPLFDQPIEAWDHGPVVPAVYRQFKAFGRRPIERSDDFDRDDFAPEVCELLDTVWTVYGQFAAWKLWEMTHSEPPWRDTTPGDEISNRSLRDFFLGLVEAGRSQSAIPGEPVWPTNSLRHQRRKEIMKSAPRRDKLRAILDRVPSPDPWADDDE